MGLVLALSIALLLAIVLTIRGWIGHRIDDHPLCRRCGFDLYGRPATSTVCPECGTDLSPPGAITVGHQVRRWRLIAGGTSLLAIAAICLGMRLYFEYSNFNWASHSPNWLLLRVAQIDWNAQSAALTELIARRENGSLPTRQYAALVNAALDAQGRASQIWDSRWADVIETAHDEGNLDSKQWRRYARQALDSAQLSLVVPPTVEIGHAFEFSIECDGARCGHSPVLQLSHEYLRLGNQSLPPCITTCIQMGGSNYDGKQYAAAALPHDLAPGGVLVRAFVHLAVMCDDQPVIAEDRTFDARVSTANSSPPEHLAAADKNSQ